MHLGRLVKAYEDLFQLSIDSFKTKLCDHAVSLIINHLCPTKINVAHTSIQRPNLGLVSFKDRQDGQFTFRGKSFAIISVKRN